MRQRSDPLLSPSIDDPALSEIVRRLVRAYDPNRVYLADVLVCTQTYFDDRLDLRASLPATIVREGVLLHAA